MRIDRILPPSQRRKGYTLCLEDGRLLRVGEAEMIDFALYSGMELEQEQLEGLEQAGTVSNLRDRAFSILSHRPCSKAELKERLQVKGATAQQAEDVAGWAEQIGLVNEADYAKTLVRHYSAKGYGAYRIKQEFYRRKLPRDLWEEALGELESPEENIDRYLQRHLKSRDRKAVKKASDALARRGFSWSDIADGLERLRLVEEDYEEV